MAILYQLLMEASIKIENKKVRVPSQRMNQNFWFYPTSNALVSEFAPP